MKMLQWMKGKVGFVKLIIHWLMVQIGLIKGEPNYVLPDKVFDVLDDEEYWKTLPKTDQMEYVPESEIEEEFRKEYPSMCNDEDRLAGCKVRDRIMPVGTTWTDKTTCTYYECIDFNNLTEISCPEWCPECRIRRCKEVPGDPNANFPDCCPTVECEPPKFRNFSELEAIADQCKHPRDCC